MMKYAPWKIGPSTRSGVDVFDSKGACVASYCTADDARLIAAAPDLYEALVLAVGTLIDIDPGLQDVIQRCQLALAKAQP